MNPKKLFNSFTQNYSKDIGLVSTSARLNANNSSTSGFLKLSGSQNLLNPNYSNYYSSDLNKTFFLNIDILKQFLSSTKNKNNKDAINLINNIISKVKQKSKIYDKIKEKKSKILIDNQIITDKKLKIDEKNFFYKNKIKEGQERIETKEENMKVLHKKMREVEIYIKKNTINLKNLNKKKIYQSFSMFNFVETNNDLINQRKELNKNIDIYKNNYSEELEENKKIKLELKKDKENKDNIDIEQKNEEKKIKKIKEKYKDKIKLMKLRINMLKNIYNKLYKKIKIMKIGDPDDINDINNNKKEDENDIDQIPLETSINMKNSFMDFSVLNTKNFDDSKDLSKFGIGNVSNIGIYDISIINNK